MVRPEESKDSPEYKKRMALQAGPVLSMTHDSSGLYGMEESLFTSLRDIFDSIIGSTSRIGVVSPHRFLEILRRDNEMFRSAMHQDAHEFLNYLLNQVVDEVERFVKQNPNYGQGLPNGNESEVTSSRGTGSSLGIENGLTLAPRRLDAGWVHDIFEGRLTSETRCLTCETTSQRDEPFLDLPVDLSPHTSVTACLRKFSEEEMLCERNKFHCDTCGGLQEAEKRMKIKRLPRVLALNLKRFKYTEDYQAQRLQKLFHRVVYPFHLRLFDTTDDAEDPDRLYELYAVVVHIGGGPYHGHYVSIIKTQDRGWLLFDDEYVEPVDKSYVMNFFGGEPVPGANDPRQLACAYVLFYQETTLEAVLREQEAEGARPSADAPKTSTVNDAPKDGAGLQHVFTATTPLAEEVEQMSPLAHASSAPAQTAAAPERPHLGQPPTSPVTPSLPVKSKKELKQEEKVRKAAAKAEEKAQVKALEEKQRQASVKRLEALKRADDEMKHAVEQSKMSAADEAKRRGDEPVASKDKEGGLARFRHGSMSLRGKPRLFGGGKERDKEKEKSGLSLTSSLSHSATATTASSTTEDSSDASIADRSLSPNDYQPPTTSSSMQTFQTGYGHAVMEEKPRKTSRLNPFSGLGGYGREKPVPGPTSAPAKSLEERTSDGMMTETANYNFLSSSRSPHGVAAQDSEGTNGGLNTPTALPPMPVSHSTMPQPPTLSNGHHVSGIPSIVAEEKAKRNRFSLGRKKSGAFT